MANPNKRKGGQERPVRLKWFGIPAMLPFIKPHKRLLIIIVVTMALSSAADAVYPLFQNYAINQYIGEGTLDTLPVFVALYLALLLFQGLINAWGGYAANTAEVRVDQDVRQACFDHVQTLSFSYFNQNSVGYIHSRIISDPNRIGQIVSWGLMDVIVCLVYIICIFAVMFLLNPMLGLMLLCVVPVIVAVTIFFQRHLTAANRKVREWNSIITGNFNEGITGAKTIKSLVVEDKMQHDFQADTQSMRLAAVRAGWFRALFQSSIIFLSSIALALVLWRGGLLTRQGLMLVGNLAVFMNYATSITSYVQDLVGTIANLINSQVNIERIDRLLHTQSDVVDTPEVIQRYGDAFHPKQENWEELRGEVEFRDVTFRYPDGEENVLEHFNLKVPQGSMVAIVGETGAGKSTLVNLCCRFFEPTSGRVLIDGKDYRERSQLWLHSNIGYVLQTPHLFSGTVKENIRYGRLDATDEEIVAAAKLVNAHDFITHMEHGYDSDVGEGGGQLSTGEKQLISFARAVLANPRIFVLDEATASIDTKTEALIQEAISTLLTGRTSFLIAHRLSTIRKADMILVVRAGKIIERGTHRELMALGGYYADLYNKQFETESAESVFSQ